MEPQADHSDSDRGPRAAGQANKLVEWRDYREARAAALSSRGIGVAALAAGWPLSTMVAVLLIVLIAALVWEWPLSMTISAMVTILSGGTLLHLCYGGKG